MSLEPLSPSEVLAEKHRRIPEFVIKAVNELLIKRVSLQGYATLTVPDVATAALEQAHLQGIGITRDELFEKNMLDIEPAFRAAGWDVKFHKTDYHDSSPDYFRFSPKT